MHLMAWDTHMFVCVLLTASMGSQDDVAGSNDEDFQVENAKERKRNNS